jgi:hypothetical protein
MQPTRSLPARDAVPFFSNGTHTAATTSTTPSKAKQSGSPGLLGGPHLYSGCHLRRAVGDRQSGDSAAVLWGQRNCEERHSGRPFSFALPHIWGFLTD